MPALRLGHDRCCKYFVVAFFVVSVPFDSQADCFRFFSDVGEVGFSSVVLVSEALDGI